MNINRIQLLISQRRWQLAEEELRRELVNEPMNPIGHAFLGIIMLGQDRTDEALTAVEHSIGLAPDMAFPHNLRGRVLYEMGEMKQADESFLTAIELDPADADHYIHRAYVLFSRSRYEEALTSVEEGLALDPEQVDGINLRGRLLIKMGREPEASEVFESSMSKDPENSFTHVNMGWAKLEAGEHKAALEHFREALRLNPENEPARAGLVEGLKARYWFYQLYLKFAYFMDGLNQKYRWALIIGLIVIARLIPALAPVYLALVFFSWFSSILFNSLIRLNPYGRYALNEDQIKFSNIFSGVLLGGVGSFVAGKLLEVGLLENLGLVLLILLFPITGTFNQKYPKDRKKSMIYTWVLVGLGSVFLLLEALQLTEISSGVFLVYVLGSVAYTWWVQTLKG
ncbi:MAG: tetratricopeptide repeat protein [Bacteroidota bacterium]